MNHGGESLNAPKYDKEVPQNHIPLLTNGTDVNSDAFSSFQSVYTITVVSFSVA